MFESLSYGLSLLLILAGLYFLFYIFVNRLLFRTGDDDFYTVVMGRNDDENLADKVYSASIQANTLNFCTRKPIFVIDCGISEEQKKACRTALFPHENIIFIKGDSESAEDEYIVIHLDKE